MKRSLAIRLAAMFAACGAIVFLVGGLLLQASLRSSLDRQVRDELAVRASLVENFLARATRAEQWDTLIVPKLEAAGSNADGIRFWVENDGPAFRFGGPPPELAGKVTQPSGYASIAVPDHACALVTLVHTVAARGDRPALRLTLVKDPAAFAQTLVHFRLVLAATVLGAVVLVALLGYWIARLGLRPLARLSKQAQALSPGEPARRLGLSPLPPELAHLTASFNGALERLEHAYQQLEAFSADVAHELRTPLMNLIGQTQVALQRRREAPALEETLRSNLEELDRMRAIVNDMLFLARADQGVLARGQEETSLSAEVLKIAEFLEPLLEDGHIRLRVEGDERVRIETALFGRAVSNLLHNAIQHSNAGDEVVVRIGRQNDLPSVSVSNPGGEIQSTHLTHLFDRFYRADASRRNSDESHGLGLSIVKAIATMHRGAVFVRSEGGWNTFGFTLGVK